MFAWVVEIILLFTFLSCSFALAENDNYRFHDMFSGEVLGGKGTARATVVTNQFEVRRWIGEISKKGDWGTWLSSKVGNGEQDSQLDLKPFREHLKGRTFSDLFSIYAQAYRAQFEEYATALKEKGLMAEYDEEYSGIARRYRVALMELRQSLRYHPGYRAWVNAILQSSDEELAKMGESELIAAREILMFHTDKKGKYTSAFESYLSRPVSNEQGEAALERIERALKPIRDDLQSWVAMPSSQRDEALAHLSPEKTSPLLMRAKSLLGHPRDYFDDDYTKARDTKNRQNAFQEAVRDRAALTNNLYRGFAQMRRQGQIVNREGKAMESLSPVMLRVQHEREARLDRELPKRTNLSEVTDPELKQAAQREIERRRKELLAVDGMTEEKARRFAPYLFGDYKYFAPKIEEVSPGVLNLIFEPTTDLKGLQTRQAMLVNAVRIISPDMTDALYRPSNIQLNIPLTEDERFEHWARFGSGDPKREIHGGAFSGADSTDLPLPLPQSLAKGFAQQTGMQMLKTTGKEFAVGSLKSVAMHTLKDNASYGIDSEKARTAAVFIGDAIEARHLPGTEFLRSGRELVDATFDKKHHAPSLLTPTKGLDLPTAKPTGTMIARLDFTPKLPGSQELLASTGKTAKVPAGAAAAAPKADHGVTELPANVFKLESPEPISIAELAKMDRGSPSPIDLPDSDLRKRARPNVRFDSNIPISPSARAALNLPEPIIPKPELPSPELEPLKIPHDDSTVLAPLQPVPDPEEPKSSAQLLEEFATSLDVPAETLAKMPEAMDAIREYLGEKDATKRKAGLSKVAKLLARFASFPGTDRFEKLKKMRTAVEAELKNSPKKYTGENERTFLAYWNAALETALNIKANEYQLKQQIWAELYPDYEVGSNQRKVAQIPPVPAKTLPTAVEPSRTTYATQPTVQYSQPAATAPAYVQPTYVQPVLYRDARGNYFYQYVPVQPQPVQQPVYSGCTNTYPTVAPQCQPRVIYYRR